MQKCETASQPTQSQFYIKLSYLLDTSPVNLFENLELVSATTDFFALSTLGFEKLFTSEVGEQ